MGAQNAVNILLERKPMLIRQVPIASDISKGNNRVLQDMSIFHIRYPLICSMPYFRSPWFFHDLSMIAQFGFGRQEGWLDVIFVRKL